MTIEYIAGFFDGEGSITYNGKGYRITISQTNKKVLQEIKKTIGTGFVFKNNKRQSHWKESWVYYIAKQKDVFEFIQKIFPFIIVKKNIANKTLKNIKNIVVGITKKDKLAKYRKKQVVLLRKQGATYRDIGKKLGVDWSYARRLTLRQLRYKVK